MRQVNPRKAYRHDITLAIGYGYTLYIAVLTWITDQFIMKINLKLTVFANA